MKRYGLFHPFLLSFYSRSLYRDVADHWKGVGFGYLLLLLAAAWIPAMVVLHRGTARIIETFGPALTKNFPTITITNGQVAIDAPEPYVVPMPGGGDPLLIVDTTGQITAENNPAAVLLTRNQLMLRGDRQTRLYDLAMVRDFRMDQAFIERMLGFVRRFLVVVAYPCALIGSYLYRILQVLVYAAIGMAFVRMSMVSLDYVQLLRLSSVAVTPAVLLDTLRGVLRVPTSYLWWIFCLLLSLGYLLFAVRAAGSEDSAEPAG